MRAGGKVADEAAALAVAPAVLELTLAVVAPEVELEPALDDVVEGLPGESMPLVTDDELRTAAADVADATLVAPAALGGAGFGSLGSANCAHGTAGASVMTADVADAGPDELPDEPLDAAASMICVVAGTLA